MPIQSRLNQYRGVNAHLHSIFQNSEGWESFHSAYIVDMARALNHDLPPGYIVDVERSLQRREYHPDTGERLRHPKPDAVIYQTERGLPPRSAEGIMVAPSFEQPIEATLEDDPELVYRAVVIHRVTETGGIGTPITRIELLSPSNKKGDGFSDYVGKRGTALLGAMKLVEIDYLHQTVTPIKHVPSYARRHPQAAAYNITISNPQPSLTKGKATTYFFGVDQPIPKLIIPLAGEDSVPLDFGAVYDQTFQSLRIYSYQVDYAELPPNFESYTPSDQTRIQQLMERLRVAVEQGVDIDARRLSDVVE